MRYLGLVAIVLPAALFSPGCGETSKSDVNSSTRDAAADGGGSPEPSTSGVLDASSPEPSTSGVLDASSPEPATPSDDGGSLPVEPEPTGPVGERDASVEPQAPSDADALPGDEPSVSGVFGPEGGRLELPLGGELVLFEGSLLESVEIVVRVIDVTDESFEPLSPAYEFLPEGLEFEVLAEAAMPAEVDFDDEDAVNKLAFLWTDAEGQFVGTPFSVDAEREFLVAPVAHFSKAVIVEDEGAIGACCFDRLCAETTAANCFDDFIPRASCSDAIIAQVCERVCCDTGDSAQFMTRRECGSDNQVVDIEECTVCCALQFGFERRLPQDCDNVVPASSCEPICCLVDNPDVGPLPTLSRDTGSFQCNSELGGDQIDDAECDNVCCFTDGETQANVSVEACLGSAHPLSHCDQVCCTDSAQQVFEIRPRVECESAADRVASGAGIEGCPVCCVTGAEASLVLFPQCAAMDGQPLASSQCDPVCCDIGGAVFPALPRVTCDAQGTILPETELGCAQGPRLGPVTPLPDVLELPEGAPPVPVEFSIDPPPVEPMVVQVVETSGSTLFDVDPTSVDVLANSTDTITFNLSSPDDRIDQGANENGGSFSYRLTDSDGNVFAEGVIPVNNVDDDVAGVNASVPDTLTADEPAVPITVEFGSEPREPVTITLSGDPRLDYGNGNGEDGVVVVEPENATIVQIPVQAIDDGTVEAGDFTTISITVTSPDPDYDFELPPATVIFSIVPDCSCNDDGVRFEFVNGEGTCDPAQFEGPNGQSELRNLCNQGNIGPTKHGTTFIAFDCEVRIFCP